METQYNAVPKSNLNPLPMKVKVFRGDMQNWTPSNQPAPAIACRDLTQCDFLKKFRDAVHFRVEVT
jgi:hypothetical protein